MAAIIPNLSAVRTMTPGERRFGQRLASLLEDDYTVWYDIPVGRKRRYPDFIILHPGRGLLFLEVKDWKLSTIASSSAKEAIISIDPERVTLQTNSGQVTVSNPLEQVRQYAYTTIDVLKRDPQLIHSEGRYKGNLCFPYGYGVVLTNITRQQWNNAIPEDERERILPSHRLICKDEMTKNMDAEDFQSRLWGMFDYTFGHKLTLPQIDRIRWQLFPEVRINAPQHDLFADPDEQIPGTSAFERKNSDNYSNTIPDIVRVMDIQQEQLAKSMGDGHRVIHGVAGSGKTLILGYRCLHLAHATSKPILVLCFNITLASHYAALLPQKA